MSLLKEAFFGFIKIVIWFIYFTLLSFFVLGGLSRFFEIGHDAYSAAIVSCLIISVLFFLFRKLFLITSQKLRNSFFRYFFFPSVFVILFFSNLHNELYLSVQEARDFLALQWGIFGVSTALFVFWISFHSKNTEANVVDEETEEKNRWIKMVEYENEVLKFRLIRMPVVLSFLNVFALAFVTCLIWTEKKYTIFYESLLWFSFCVCANTLIIVFQSLFDCLKADKTKELLKNKGDYKLKEALLFDATNIRNGFVLAIIQPVLPLIDFFQKKTEKWSNEARHSVDKLKKNLDQESLKAAMRALNREQFYLNVFKFLSNFASAIVGHCLKTVKKETETKEESK